jgi:hypothetical protein
MRRILNKAAHAAVKAKGGIFRDLYSRLVPRLGHRKATWAVAHKLCRVVWKILHVGVEYQERGNRPNPQTIKRRVDKLVRHLRGLGYQVELSPVARLGFFQRCFTGGTRGASAEAT